MAAKIDQKAYLQKYLHGPSDKKKKKKKKVASGRGLKIIDDDIDLSKLQELQGDELDILDQGEDAPQIAGIIDERPEEVKKAELFQSSSKWRVVTKDDGFNTKLQVEEIKRDIKEVEKENEVIFGKMYSDSEDENKSNSDASPPRKQSNERHTTAKKPRSASDSDFSPPRRKESNKGQKSSPRNREKHSKRDHNDRDVSPQRKDRNHYDSDLSPPRKQSKGNESRYDSDVSPPRRNDANSSRNRSEKSERNRERRSRWDNVDDKLKHRDNSNSISPKRSKKTDSSKRKSRRNSSDSDLSPPRQTQKYNKSRRNSSSDTSPPRKQKKDFERKRTQGSPPRRNLNRDNHDRYDDLDSSSHRKERKSYNNNKHKDGGGSSQRKQDDSDASPPRKSTKKSKKKSKYKDNSESDSDSGPSRKDRKHKNNKQSDDSDLSPPRKEKRMEYRRNSNSPPPTNKKMAKTLEGKLAGLQDAVQLRQENEAFRRREDEAYSRLTDDVSGRNAKAVSRKSKRETSEERQKKKDKAERQKELDEKYKKWNRGLKQIEAQEERVQDYLHEAAKPLARYKDDQDLEHRLKEIERDGDPMLGYIRDRKRERGELAPAKPTYKGNFPPNRFNIRPGYRWDGVDRSNGYEKKFFDQQSKRKAMEEDAYKWSTEDL